VIIIIFYNTSTNSSVHLPFVVPSRFFNSLRITLFAASVCPLVWGVLNRACYWFYVEVLIKGLEVSVNELSTIDGDDSVRDSKSTHNASPYEVLNILGWDGGEGLSFDPLSEVVDPDQEKLCPPFSRVEGADNVHSQMAKDHGDTVLWSVSCLRWDRGPNS